MAQVLLGICEEQVLDSVTSWNVNKLGGTPDWYPAAVDPCNSYPSCGVCGCRLAFICQLYCPVSGSHYHRTLYVFACCNMPCWNKENSWAVLRCQLPSIPEPTESTRCSDSDADDWGVNGISWGDDGDDSECNDEDVNLDVKASTKSLLSESDVGPSGGPAKVAADHPIAETQVEDMNCDFDDEALDVADKMSCLAIGGARSKKDDVSVASTEAEMQVTIFAEDLSFNPADSNFLNILEKSVCSDTELSGGDKIKFDMYFINVYDEEDFAVNVKDCSDLGRRYFQEDTELLSFLHEGKNKSASSRRDKSKKSSSKCAFEEDGEHEYDKKPQDFEPAVLKYSKKLKRCPQQVIRYSYNGTPLHFDERAAKRTIPPCSCGSNRVFEAQLMPKMVDLLKTSDDSDSFLEFGGVYIFTCARNCWVDESVGARQEFCFAVDFTDLPVLTKWASALGKKL